MRGRQRHDPLPGRGPVVQPRLEHDGASPAPASTRRTAPPSGPVSAPRTRVPHHVLEDPGIGEVAEEHDMTF
jgi:hypothetical protein